MIRNDRSPSLAIALIAGLGLFFLGASCAEAEESPRHNPCNPCAAKQNPCNPCAAQQNPCNPCGTASIDPERVRQPAGVVLASAPRSQLLARGEKLWNDRGLGTTGLACSSCHQGYAQMNASFAKPYPHQVGMPYAQAGLAQVNAAEMVNFCMLVPMNTEPLDWRSTDLAALSAYVEHLQQDFDPGPAAAAANPCEMKRSNPCNPCEMKRSNPCNPCEMKRSNPCNPCEMKRSNPCNPCEMKRSNPCAMQPSNPCAMQRSNPCNPCGAR